MIYKLRLKNWKSHEDSELEFAPGTNGLVGIVGSGKTSVLDAICFAFFGTFPKLQMRKLKIEDVIMKKPSVKDSAEVEVSFMVDGTSGTNGNKYSVKRIIDRMRGTAYSELTENGKMIESPSTKNVTAAVEKILKVNYELFSKAIYSEQNSLDYFLTLGKGQRMGKIDELLMIDRFEEARANAVKLTNKIIERKIGMQSAVEQFNIAEAENAIEEIEKSVSDLESENMKLAAALEEVSKKKADAESEFAELRKIKENLESLKRTDSGVESAINTTIETIGNMEKSLKEFYDKIGEKVVEEEGVKVVPAEIAKAVGEMIENYSKKINEMNDFLKTKQAEYEEVQRELAKSRANVEFLKKEKIERLGKELEEKMKIKGEFEKLRDRTGENVDEQIREKQAALQRLVGEIEAARARMSDLQEQLDNLSSVEGVCPLCGTNISSERKNMIIIEKQRDLDALGEKIERALSEKNVTDGKMRQLELAAKTLEEMLNAIVDFDKVRDEFEKSKLLFAQYTTAAENLGEQVESFKQEIDIVKKEFENTTNEKQRLEIINAQTSDYERQKQRMEELRTEREKLKAGIAELEKHMETHRLEDAEQMLRALMISEKEHEIKMTHIEEIAAERKMRLEEFRKALESAWKEKAEIEKLDALVSDLKIFAEALKQTQAELRKEFVEAVNYTMNKLWQTLYPYQDFVGIRLAIEEGDYVLQLQERALSWINAEGVASGGERSIACLALRIAFALVLAPQMRLLILDEPTANLDSNSIGVLATTLRENINEFIDQCFIITHDEALEEAVTGNAYRFERDKAKDEATRVIAL